MTDAVLPAAARRRLPAGTGATGVVLVGLWIVFGIVLLGALFLSVDPDRLSLYGPRIVSGFWLTLRLCAISLIAGAVLSLPVAFGRLSRNWLPSTLAYAYSYFFRGTPLIAQMFLIYYGAGEFAPQLKAIGLWWFFRDAFNCAVFSFAINTAAYQAEILAGAIRAVPRGQSEAASALALRGFTTMRKVILPQALITALRPYGNEIILIVKASSIASIITVLDLMGQTRYAFSKTYDLSLYLWAAIFYLITVEALRRVWNVLERRLTRHLERR